MEISIKHDDKTPKQVLLLELENLADNFSHSSLYQNELFLQDLEYILTILSSDEVISFILPCFEIYAEE